MAFVAEYISKEDLEKYNVVNIVNKYRIKYRCRTPLSDMAIEQLDWVVDRQRDIWFMFVCDPCLPDP